MLKRGCVNFLEFLLTWTWNNVCNSLVLDLLIRGVTALLATPLSYLYRNIFRCQGSVKEFYCYPEDAAILREESFPFQEKTSDQLWLRLKQWFMGSSWPICCGSRPNEFSIDRMSPPITLYLRKGIDHNAGLPPVNGEGEGRMDLEEIPTAACSEKVSASDGVERLPIWGAPHQEGMGCF